MAKASPDKQMADQLLDLAGQYDRLAERDQ